MKLSFICIVKDKIDDHYIILVDESMIKIPIDGLSRKIFCNIELPINKLIYVSDADLVIDNNIKTVIVNDFYILVKQENKVLNPIENVDTSLSKEVKEIIEDSKKYPFDLFI